MTMGTVFFIGDRTSGTALDHGNVRLKAAPSFFRPRMNVLVKIDTYGPAAASCASERQEQGIQIGPISVNLLSAKSCRQLRLTDC